MEVTKRVKAILQKKDPNSVPEMNSRDLQYKYEKRVGQVKCDSAKEVVHTALILKEQGIKSMVDSCSSVCSCALYDDSVPSILFCFSSGRIQR